MSGRSRGTARRVLVITGSRAEYGLLKPVMEAIRRNKKLELRVVVSGEHLLAPAMTWKEVGAEFRIDAKVAMQRPGDRGRIDHAAACGRGVAGFAAAYKKLKPDWVVVLGDRIEAFAAASAASIGGIAVCHIHGGDRAEGIADEAMRHAITKLAHLHCAATKRSADRIRRLGENAEYVFTTGSPAIDGLASIKPMSDRDAARLGDPLAVVALHPAGGTAEEETSAAAKIGFVLWAIDHPGLLPGKSDIDWSRVLLLEPNGDPGREAIVDMWDLLASRQGASRTNHLPRDKFLSLMVRLRERRGALIGNSSAGLIEAAALGVPFANIGPRQAGRERGTNVVDFSNGPNTPPNSRAFDQFRRLVAKGAGRTHPFGDGRAGPRIAALLAKVDPHGPAVLRKRNSY